MRSLVLTIIGPDRPGLVGTLSSTIIDHGGNWLESQMSHLGGHFAGIVQVEVEEPGAAALMAALKSLEVAGLRIHVASEPLTAPESFSKIELELVGTDRAGIVRDISLALADQGVNVETLSSTCESGAMSGSRIFRAAATLRVPTGLALDAIQRRLEAIANDLMVDLQIA